MAKPRPPKGKTITTTVQEVLNAVALCKDNAIRLLYTSLQILNSKGPPDIGTEIAYILWTFALEEYGKGLLLTDQIAGLDPTSSVTVRLSTDHAEKSRVALERVPDLGSETIRRRLYVHSVKEKGNVTIEDPYNKGVSITISELSSGVEYEDASNFPFINAPEYLRFAFLYVDWDENMKKFGTGATVNIPPGVDARWRFNESDIQRVVTTLLLHLAWESGQLQDEGKKQGKGKGKGKARKK